MTFTEDFVPESEQELEEENKYPVLFGYTITPLIGGVALGIVGFIGFFYLLFTQIFPLYQEVQKLNQDKEAKTIQLEQEGKEQELKLQQKQRELELVQGLKPQILQLFPNEKTLDTLLLDLNSFIQPQTSELLSFRPQQEASLVNDSSLGADLNGKVKKKSLNLEIEGNFEEIQKIMRDIERLEPLLIVKDFRSDVIEQPILVYKGGKLKPQGAIQLKVSFRLDMILPLTETELAANETEKQP